MVHNKNIKKGDTMQNSIIALKTAGGGGLVNVSGLSRSAFTLAEVLITLGIIGVVAALTLPGLIQNHTKTTVETKLKKFYSQINQAILLSESEYGDRDYWYADTNSVETDKDGKPVNGSSTAEKWFNKYIGAHMKVVQTDYDNKGLPTFYFADGTALKMFGRGIEDNNTTQGMRDWMFYTTNPEKCIKLYGSEQNSRGKCAFAFLFGPTTTEANGKKGFESYQYNTGGNENTIKTRCKTQGQYCTAVIQMNGWKIPDDYPYKVSY